MNVQSFAAGDTLDFVETLDGYPPSDGWTLKYRYTPGFTSPAQTPIDLTATVEGSSYRVQSSPGTTATWKVGVYTWTRWVEKAGARVSLGSGRFQLTADPSTLSAGYDGRSQAALAVAQLEAALATYSSSKGHVQEYEINGRSMTFRKTSEILELLSFWRAELARETSEAATAAGAPSKRRVHLRFGHA